MTLPLRIYLCARFISLPAFQTLTKPFSVRTYTYIYIYMIIEPPCWKFDTMSLENHVPFDSTLLCGGLRLGWCCNHLSTKVLLDSFQHLQEN